MAGLILGCSDDDDPTGPGTPPYVNSVVVTPGSAILNAIGEDIQFDADAYDQNGAPIEADFIWGSSDEDVVVVGQDGVAVSTGVGMAVVYSTADGVADSAEVTVTLAGGPVHEWVSASDGDWNDATNWSTNQVPGVGDVAVIDEDGTYTVTLTGNVEVLQLVVGAGAGSQTIDTDGNTLRVRDGGLDDGADVLVSGTLVIYGDVVWSGGAVRGSGQVVIEGGGELRIIGNPLDFDVPVDNRGTLMVGAGASLRVNKLLECATGALLDLQGDARVTVQGSGNLSSSGSIRKWVGDDEASILASSAQFNSTGSVRVNAGSLWVSGGSLRGTMEIDGDAMLRQTSNTDILSVNSLGDGPFVVGGTVSLGASESQIITFRNLILDSSSLTSITGPAALLIDRSFVWKRGRLHSLPSINTQVGSRTTFENTGTSILSATTFKIRGEVAGDSNVNLELAEGAVLVVERPGSWIQSTGGTVKQGSGDTGAFNVIGEFCKRDEGTFVVETAFSCSGTLKLWEGTLTVQGDFELTETGLITGGGVEDLTYNRRLIVLDAPTAVMSGTIRPELENGGYARIDIQGLSELTSTFRIKVDVVTDGDFNTESVYFLTSGQGFGGTLELNAVKPADPGVDYRVIYSFASQGEFSVTGDAPFDEVEQSHTGVICRRF